jgi:hypothetical protein
MLRASRWLGAHHWLCALLVAGGICACALSGCSAETSTGGGNGAPAGHRPEADRLTAESLPDDVERIDPLDSDELAAWLAAERRPVSPSGGKSVARIIPKDASKPRYGDQVAPGDIDAKAETKVPDVKLFDRWPKPKLAVVISGLQNGYLEPCGCAGLENMKGGLMRRHTFLKSLQDEAGYGWPAVLAVDLGNLVGRYGWQAEQKYETAVQALKVMNYDAIAYGPDDLRLGPNALLLAAATADADARFVAANVALTGWDAPPPSRYRVVERGGYKIGITAVLGKRYSTGLADVLTKPAAEALAEVMPKFTAERCDLSILLSHATMDETKELLKRFPKFDIVVTAGGPDEPPLSEEKVPGTNTWLIESGRKGMYLQVIGLFDDVRAPRRFQRVPVDAHFKDSPDVQKLMVELQKTYKDNYEVGEKAKGRSGWEALGIRPLPHPTGRTFAGSETCADCHKKAYRVWSKTGHAHATETLEKLEIPRQYDPECLSCHVTGWEPQKYFPFKGGYESIAKTAHLAANGCENCHGPGQRHVDIESGTAAATPDEKAKARGQMRVTIAQAKASTCAACHDLDNSPDYVKHGFDAYWPKIEHKGKD